MDLEKLRVRAENAPNKEFNQVLKFLIGWLKKFKNDFKNNLLDT